MSAEIGDGAGDNRGDLYTSFQDPTGPKFGHGLKPMPLRPSKEGQSSLTCSTPWSGKNGIPMARSPKHNSTCTSNPGPGQYERPRDYDNSVKRPHATMGLPWNGSVFTEEFKTADVSRSACGPSRRAQTGTWRRAPRMQAPDAAGPGPGRYSPHGHIKGQGTSFGMRPDQYTGQVAWPAPPGPGSYHVECTTLGAATRGHVDTKST